jgi:hypothetical protein
MAGYQKLCSSDAAVSGADPAANFSWVMLCAVLYWSLLVWANRHFIPDSSMAALM